jgi:exocyst complex component 2
MALEIIQLYISDARVSQPHASQTSAASTAMPLWVPRESNSLTTGVWVGRMLSEIAECVAEVNGLEIGDSEGGRGSASVSAGSGGGSSGGFSGGLAGLRNLMESARWRFEEAICETWAAGQSGLFVQYSLDEGSC